MCESGGNICGDGRSNVSYKGNKLHKINCNSWYFIEDSVKCACLFSRDSHQTLHLQQKLIYRRCTLQTWKP